MSAQRYFHVMSQSQKRLSQHGFERFPSDEEALEYAMDLDDRIQAVCTALRVETYRGPDGRWYAERMLEAI